MYGLSLHMNQAAYQSSAYSQFLTSMNCLGDFFSLRRDASSLQGYIIVPSITFAGTHLYTLEKRSTVWGKHLPQEHHVFVGCCSNLDCLIQRQLHCTMTLYLASKHNVYNVQCVYSVQTCHHWKLHLMIDLHVSHTWNSRASNPLKTNSNNVCKFSGLGEVTNMFEYLRN